MGVHCCCLHINYIVYKDFVRSMHIGSLDPTCAQIFRPVPLTVFEILGFNLKNKNDKKNCRNRPFAISPMLVVQFQPNFRCTYILTSAIMLWCQKWIITESKSQIKILECTGKMGQDLVHPYLQSTDKRY